MKKRALPSIGITTGTSLSHLRAPELYVKAIKEAGGSAEFISPSSDVIEASKQYDGIIIPGGRDIAPVFYNAKRRSKISPEEDERIRFEFSLLREIIKKRKPVFGICYGMQLINVFFEGTLNQDIDCRKPGVVHHRKGIHKIKICPNPYVMPGEYTVTSSHHQSIKNPGMGLQAFAFSADGVTEAIYHQEADFLLGVQWHPERSEGRLSRHLFSIFIEASCGNK